MGFEREKLKYGPIGQKAIQEGLKAFDAIHSLMPGRSMEFMAHTIDDYFKYDYNELKGEQPGSGFEKWLKFLETEDIKMISTHRQMGYIFRRDPNSLKGIPEIKHNKHECKVCGQPFNNGEDLYYHYNEKHNRNEIN